MRRAPACVNVRANQNYDAHAFPEAKDIALDILARYYIAYGDSFLCIIDARYLCDRIAIQKGKQGGTFSSSVGNLGNDEIF